MTKVKTKSYGIIHFHARCTDCEWEMAWCADRSQSAVRNAAYRHAQKENHIVTIETGKSTDYIPEGREL